MVAIENHYETHLNVCLPDKINSFYCFNCCFLSTPNASSHTLLNIQTQVFYTALFVEKI